MTSHEKHDRKPDPDSATSHTSAVSVPFEDEYEVLRKGAGLIPRRDIEYLYLEGKDTLDLLNRISTNDLSEIPADEVRGTVFVTEKGKIVDLVTVIPHGSGFLLALASGNASLASQWIERFVIMEDVRVARPASGFISYHLAGPRVNSALQIPTDDVKTSSTKIHSFDVPGVVLRVFRNFLFVSNVWDVLAPAGSEKIVEGWFAGKGVQAVGGKAFETLRIEDGIPAYGKEITEQVNPLEARLDTLVSLTKGCYLGQEVIARLDTYKKLQRRLEMFSGELEMVEGGSRVLRDDQDVGWITSRCYSPRSGTWVALGYLKGSALGGSLVVRSSIGKLVPLSRQDVAGSRS